MKIAGRKRRIPVEVEQRIRNWKPLVEFASEKGWKPLPQVAAECGITFGAARMIREGYHFKNRAPGNG